MARSFSYQKTAVRFQQADQFPAASCDAEFHFLCIGIGGMGLLPVHFKDQFYGVGQILQTLFPGFTLAIGTSNFKTGGPIPAFAGLSLMNDGCELMHAAR